jgi:predicted nucleotidyltransferase component of viral defense system
MLHYETVLPGTFTLLKDLSKLDSFQKFSLVGGTALSLRYGHRHSEDLDFFSNENFDRQAIIEELVKIYSNQFIHQETGFKKSLFCSIKDVKVDVVYYPHLLIRPLINEDDIIFYSDEDIAAMKIQAILGRGKKKDFWDLALLLEKHGLGNIIDWHTEKFPNQMLLISIPQTITYFDDAELSQDPICLLGLSWEDVKNKIRSAVRDYLS